MADQWYFERGGAPAGPVSFAELQRLAQTGVITRDTRAWSDGMSDWVSASAIGNLFAGGPPALGVMAPLPVYANVAPQPGGTFCSSCGQPIHPHAEICPRCGVRQRGAGGTRNRTTAALLAFFLGGFGVHKFYLGQGGQGILYLLFFWTFIPSLIALVEFVMFLSMSDAEFARKYG